MRSKRNYNNLFDSICMTILFFVCLAFYLVIIWFGVFNFNEGTNPNATLIISSIVFGVIIFITTFLIIKFCYGYWILSDDLIIYKTLFSKKVKIKLTDIEKVEKKMVSAFVLGVYKSEAFIVYFGVRKIVILIKENKKYSELEYELTKFINCSEK